MRAQVNQYQFEIRNYRRSTFRGRPAYYITDTNGKVERIKKDDYFSICNNFGNWVTIQNPHEEN